MKAWIYLVECTGLTCGEPWQHVVSWHDSLPDAVIAAAGYRRSYQLNFGRANPDGRKWQVERVALTPGTSDRGLFAARPGLQ
ncbi:MAG: hypothetical protein ACT4OM_02995 [Actinomycetota bacterium]